MQLKDNQRRTTEACEFNDPTITHMKNDSSGMRAKRRDQNRAKEHKCILKVMVYARIDYTRLSRSDHCLFRITRRLVIHYGLLQIVGMVCIST